MSELQELLGVNSDRAFNFFYSALTTTVGDNKKVSIDEMKYVASVLAHNSITSRSDVACMPSPGDLSEIFDNFVFREEELRDPELLEIAGAQSLFLAGFFRDQMRRRHNVRWYDSLGISFYGSASRYSKSSKRQWLFERLSVMFPYWTITCRDLSREMYDNRYIIRPSS